MIEAISGFLFYLIVLVYLLLAPTFLFSRWSFVGAGFDFVKTTIIVPDEGELVGVVWEAAHGAITACVSAT